MRWAQHCKHDCPWMLHLKLGASLRQVCMCREKGEAYTRVSSPNENVAFFFPISDPVFLMKS